MNNEHTSSIHDFEFELICDYYKELERQGPGSPEVTKKALSFVEGLTADSKIADLGCGTGTQTITLAQNTEGHITGLDLFPAFIDKFNQNINKKHLGSRITTLVGSMNELPFNEKEFDLIWSEGAIYNIGFQYGLKLWNKYLKPGGYVAVSEVSWFTESRPAEIENFWMDAYPEIDTIPNKVMHLQNAGYIPVAHFILPVNCWTKNFYEPMLPVQKAYIERNGNNKIAMEFLKNQQHEKNLYYKYNSFYGYVFYIGKKDIINN